jgi:Plasmid stabilization system protein
MAGLLAARYTISAFDDISEIYRYIACDDPGAAADVLAAIGQAVELLRLFPLKSRATQRRGVRALPLSHYPYIIFFRVKGRDLEILHILHGARRHPQLAEEPREFIRA